MARLAAAQAAQRATRRRLVHSRLQAVQARIDPQLLFEMLDAVRRAYDDDVSRAERLLDELVTFLRAALPRVRSTSSSVRREGALGARLRATAHAGGCNRHRHEARRVSGSRGRALSTRGSSAIAGRRSAHSRRRVRAERNAIVQRLHACPDAARTPIGCRCRPRTIAIDGFVWSVCRTRGRSRERRGECNREGAIRARLKFAPHPPRSSQRTNRCSPTN